MNRQLVDSLLQSFAVRVWSELFNYLESPMRHFLVVLLSIFSFGGPVEKASAESVDANARKAVLVTGASSGIGNRIALTLADKGFYVYAGARKAEDIAALSVLANIEGHLKEIKDEREILLISDLNKKISQVVLNEPAPFIYERTGERFKNLLFDEFQDTSLMQWQNFLLYKVIQLLQISLHILRYIKVHQVPLFSLKIFCVHAKVHYQY